MPRDLGCPTPSFMTSDETSFASVSAQSRWPIILTSAIDDVSRTIFESTDDASRQQGKVIVEQLAALKYEMQHNRKLLSLREDAGADIADYNEQLAYLGPPTWHNVAWLFSECYLYRRMHSLFTAQSHWLTYDVFARQKLSTMKSSRPAILELAVHYRSLIEQFREDDKIVSSEEKSAAEQLLFAEMCEICLWGNATDLSLLTSLTYEDIQKLQGAKARKAAEHNILVNDLGQAYQALQVARGAGKIDRQVDFVLDNAGFELFVDLVLAGFLLESGLATSVVFHPKSMPWFVSDVIATDFQAMLQMLSRPNEIFATEVGGTPAGAPLSSDEVESLDFLFQQWSSFHAEGQLILRPNSFWTTGKCYWSLPAQEPELYRDLQASELVIFKGDLNYRKLTFDVGTESAFGLPLMLQAMWNTTTPFEQAIGPMGRRSGIRVLSLRTCKADTVVGLPQGLDQKLREANGEAGSQARKWAWGGKYAVISFSDGKA